MWLWMSTASLGVTNTLYALGVFLTLLRIWSEVLMSVLSFVLLTVWILAPVPNPSVGSDYEPIFAPSNYRRSWAFLGF